MAYFIVFQNPYDTYEALKNLTQYISDMEKSRGYIGAQNMLVNYALEEILKVNQFFYNQTQKKVIHFLISFGEDEYISVYDLYWECYRVCALLPEYQILFSIHQNT